jgi:hypothetical protein
LGNYLLTSGIVILPERQYEHSLFFIAGDGGKNRRPDEALNCEIFIAGVHFGSISDGIYRLETYPEAPDCSYVLGALGNGTNSSNVPLVERLAEMRDSDGRPAYLECDDSRSAPVPPPSKRIFCILE